MNENRLNIFGEERGRTGGLLEIRCTVPEVLGINVILSNFNIHLKLYENSR